MEALILTANIDDIGPLVPQQQGMLSGGLEIDELAPVAERVGRDVHLREVSDLKQRRAAGLAETKERAKPRK